MSEIHTITSRQFVHNVSAAKRAAAEGNHVIITDRGAPTFALLPIAEYRRLTNTNNSLVDLLRMPDADAFDVDFGPININAKEIDA